MRGGAQDGDPDGGGNHIGSEIEVAPAPTTSGGRQGAAAGVAGTGAGATGSAAGIDDPLGLGAVGPAATVLGMSVTVLPPSELGGAVELVRATTTIPALDNNGARAAACSHV